MHKSKFKIYKIMLIIVKNNMYDKQDNIDNTNITESSYNVNIYDDNNKGYIWDDDNTIRNRNNNSTTGNKTTIK